MAHNYPPRPSPENPFVSASVVGARGYAGLELARLLLDHPFVRLTHCFATTEFRLSDEILHPKASSVTCLSQDALLENLTDVVFLATPAEVSLELAPVIVAQGKLVIDLSGAFRLRKNDVARWYSFSESEERKAVLETVDYGLVPFCGPWREKTRLVANPGCYASAISLALIPLLKHDLIDGSSLAIDAKSGTTGAGRKAGENLLFSEVDNECLPYRVGKHQHFPEIQEAVETFAGVGIDPHFVTHLLPVRRGITAAIFARSLTQDLRDIQEAFQKEYGTYPFIRFGSDVTRLAKLTPVVRSPYTHLSYSLTGNKLYLFSVLDNLMKGAASQAVENLNRFLDLPLTSALTREV